RARSEGPRGRSADPRSRRRRDRIPAPAPRRGARRGARDPARLARARRGALALRPRARHVRGTDRRRARRRAGRGEDRPRDARRAQARGGGGGMSESLAPQGPQPPHLAEEPPVTVAARLALFQRAGGIVTPVITAVIAFLIGGLVVLATGHNPLRAYWSIIQGAGLNWFAHPWVTDTSTHISTYNFVQTLIQTTTLVLTGLAVAFAFRCGLFNIGGQGQYLVGVFVATWVGVNFAHMAGPAHILLGVAAAAAAGAI